jgi:hypothetical protein
VHVQPEYAQQRYLNVVKWKFRPLPPEVRVESVARLPNEPVRDDGPGPRFRHLSGFTPHVVGHPVMYLSLSWEETPWFVIESNHFLFLSRRGISIRSWAVSLFFGGGFTGQVP